MVCFLNGNFINYSDASLHISDLGLLRGYGIFDFFRTTGNAPLFLDDHLNRFYASAKTVRLQVPIDREKIAAAIDELIRRNALDFSGVRLLLTGGYSEDGYLPTGKANLVITQQRMLPTSIDNFEKGISLVSYEHVRELPRVKSLNYLTGIHAQPLLAEHNADDVIFHSGGRVSECPRNNIFLVDSDSRIFTPERDVLFGITRKHILAMDLEGFTIAAADFSLQDLLNAREVFITSTTKRVMPVVRVDGKTIGNGRPGAVTRRVYKNFLNIENAATGKS